VTPRRAPRPLGSRLPRHAPESSLARKASNTPGLFLLIFHALYRCCIQCRNCCCKGKCCNCIDKQTAGHATAYKFVLLFFIVALSASLMSYTAGELEIQQARPGAVPRRAPGKSSLRKASSQAIKNIGDALEKLGDLLERLQEICKDMGRSTAAISQSLAAISCPGGVDVGINEFANQAKARVGSRGRRPGARRRTAYGGRNRWRRGRYARPSQVADTNSTIATVDGIFDDMIDPIDEMEKQVRTKGARYASIIIPAIVAVPFSIYLGLAILGLISGKVFGHKIQRAAASSARAGGGRAWGRPRLDARRGASSERTRPSERALGRAS